MPMLQELPASRQEDGRKALQPEAVQSRSCLRENINRSLCYGNNYEPTNIKIMKFYIRGVMAKVSEPEVLRSGTTVQHCLIQHEFNQEPKFNKYMTFDIFGADRIQQMALREQEEVELALNINVQIGTGGRYFNNIIAFAVERDKHNFHYYENNRQRVAVTPNAVHDDR